MIIADMDGVFANFADASATIHGRSTAPIKKWNYFSDWGLTPEQFWKPIIDQGDAFYEEMVLPYPWALELLELISQTDDFIFMSAPGCGTRYGYAAKKIWIDKYLQPHVVDPIKLIVGSEKQLLARDSRILIDDYDENIKKFRKAGGYALTFPQPWNAQRRAALDAVLYVRDRLTSWKEIRINALQKRAAEGSTGSLSWPKSDSPGY